MTLDEYLVEHAGHIGLQLSGGRDSVAMLCSLTPWQLGQVTVYHLDSGDSFPETRHLIRHIKGIIGDQLVVIQGAVHQTQDRYGWPSDVLHSGAGWPYAGIKDNLRLLDRHECCVRSIMVPLHERMVADGITLLLRGQRRTDEPKSPVKHGDMADGMTILYPIEEWTDEQVAAECGELLPPFYADGATSAPDCMHCTAWLEHNAVPYLTKHHPAVASVVHARLAAIRVHVEPFIKRLENTSWVSA